MPDSCLKCTKISVLALPQFLLYGYATFFLLLFLFFIINILYLGTQHCFLLLEFLILFSCISFFFSIGSPFMKFLRFKYSTVFNQIFQDEHLLMEFLLMSGLDSRTNFLALINKTFI